MKNHTKFSSMRGFTLIEIMVVIVILGIMATMIVPKMLQRPEQARQIKAKQDILAIQNALALYKLDNGCYPSTEQGLQALVETPKIPPFAPHWQSYLQQLPSDPWGQAYQYLYPGVHGEIDIFSYSGHSPTAIREEEFIGNWHASTG